MNRCIRSLSCLFGLVVTLGALGAAPAFAAPSLGVTLKRDDGPGGIFSTVHHSDERVDFTARVKDTAAPPGAPSADEPLSCSNVRSGSTWLFNEIVGYDFLFRWVRDGAAITAWEPATKVFGEEGAGFGTTTYVSTYTAQAADAGHAIQCEVKGTNEAGTGSDVIVSQPVVVVNPQPAVAPPSPNTNGSERRPEISGSATAAGEKLTCTAPTTGWSVSNEASPITWTFEWLRDGEPATGTVTPVSATESEYELTAEDVTAPAAPALFQCIAKATNASGSALVESGGVTTAAPAPEFIGFTAPLPSSAYAPMVENAANTVVGQVTVELELPASEETFAYETEGEGWSCERHSAVGAQPAKAVCSREGVLPPGAEYPPLTVITALGADVPDLATARATAFGGGGVPGSAELAFPIAPAIPFGLDVFTAALLDNVGDDYTQAGGHAFKADSEVVVKQKRSLVPPAPLLALTIPIAQVKQVVVDVPPGVVGNALALPELCPGTEEVKEVECPPGSVVGGIRIHLSDALPIPQPIYAIKPEFGTPAQFAFTDGLKNVYTFTPRLRANDGYAVSFELAAATEVDFLDSTVTLCDFGGKVAGTDFDGCKEKSEADSNPKPLFTNPTRCHVPLTTRVRLNSWSDPTFVEGPPFANAQITGCEAVPFEPQTALKPTNGQADSPAGLDVSLSMPTEGLEKVAECHEKQGDESSPLAAECIAQSNVRQAKITFPEGMAVNASAGQGLNACSAEQIKLGTNDPISCPESSKIGSVEIETPLIEDTLKGDVYIAKQGQVEGSTIGFYMVFDSPKNGILVKLPAKVDTNPNTGQLVATVNEIPQQPFSAVHMHFPGGPKATLLTPPKCGTYKIDSELTPWSGGAPVTQSSSFIVSTGPNGGPCPSGALGAKLNAGSENPVAGKTSPFNLRLTREDGSGRFTGLNLTTPPGETAYLKDIPYCPQSAIDMAKSREKEGLAILEANNPSCSAASLLGVASAGAGAGPEPLFVNTGRAYLAGPYKGAPVSLVLIAPALAGPLDLGNVVVQTALNINPETAQVSAISDAIPTILHGLLIDIREIMVSLNRPHFTLNPTNCDPLSVSALVRGEGGATQQLSNRFQVGGCDKLSFKPKLGVRLIGGTRRGGHPRLKGTLEAAPGEANIGRAAVTIPRSEFLDQAHIRTICTRVQFAADACPKGSVYGHGTATTPLLGYPVEGPVYLRSSNHKLPDLVVDLHGPDWQPIEAVVVGRIDSIKGQIRTTFENAPDVPLTKFVLSMRGGKKGLLVNSRNICATTNKATVALTGHNNAEFSTRPAVKNSKCNSGRKAKKAKPKHKK